MPRQRRQILKSERRKRRVAARRRNHKILSGYLLAQTITGVASGSVASIAQVFISAPAAQAVESVSGFTFKGEWDELDSFDTGYNVGDVVTYQGSSYLVIKNIVV